MKHLLIILSILLLSSPVIGEEVGVLYQYETSSGIKWKSFGDGKVQPKYKGEIKNGQMDGLGILTYPYSGKSIVGEWKNGEEWNTKHNNKDGELLGKFENGEWIVRGTETYPPPGEHYVGEFNKDGKRHGQGIYTWSNGDKYVGEYKNGKANGKGTRTSLNGKKYVGEWKDGKKHGQGTQTYSDGYKYEGGWKNGKRHGKGTYTHYDGYKFVGEYKDGIRNGQGTDIWSNGEKYVGEWKRGERWNGTGYNENGNIIGKWLNGVKQ